MIHESGKRNFQQTYLEMTGKGKVERHLNFENEVMYSTREQ